MTRAVCPASLLLAAASGLGGPLPVVVLPHGDLAAMRQPLSRPEACTLKIRGEFVVDEALRIERATRFVLDGSGAAIVAGARFGVVVSDSRDLEIVGLEIRDTSRVPDPATLFDFRRFSRSGLSDVTYSSLHPRRNFAWIRTASRRFSVRRCRISRVAAGILLGDNGDAASPHIEPPGGGGPDLSLHRGRKYYRGVRDPWDSHASQGPHPVSRLGHHRPGR